MINVITQPRTIKEVIDLLNTAYIDGSTFENLKMLVAIMEDEAHIKSILNKLTKPELSRFTGYLSSSDKKERFVSSAYDNLIGHLNYSRSISYSPTDETYQQARKRVFNAQTLEGFEAYKAKLKADKEAKEKALNNPQTLEEFRLYIDRKGFDSLTEEQKANYDELKANLEKKIQERTEAKNKEIQPISVNVSMELKHSRHTKKNIPLFVVVMSERVSKDKYFELNGRAKKLGGYYSSYTKEGAIAGFTFENEQNAIDFMSIDKPIVKTTEEPKETESKTDEVYSKLIEKAEKMIAKGEEELNRDRQANTHRRATMAQNAENQALATINFGKTLKSIAEAIKEGNIKYLGKINTITELETLNSILATAKYRHLQADKLNSREEYKYSSRTAEFVKVPYPQIYKSALSDMNKISDYTGKRQAGKRIIAKLERLRDNYDCIVLSSQSDIEDLRTILKNSNITDKWIVERYKKYLTEYDRIARLGLDNIYSLRSAIRELIMIKTGNKVNPELLRIQKLRELERKFIGAKISGFFPTPEELSSEIVELASIQEGNTILEPNGGLGHLAEAIQQQHPNNKIKCIEVINGLCEVLEAKGFDTECMDFLQHTEKYDRIVMNPPFENHQDIDHVLHAYSLLNEGGRLVAIMANNKAQSNKKCTDFMEFIESKGGEMYTNQDGAFKTSFRPTGVSTITIVIDK